LWAGRQKNKRELLLLLTWPPVRLFATSRSPRRPGSRAMCSWGNHTPEGQSVVKFSFSPRYPHLLPEEMRKPDLETLGRVILNPDGPGWQFSEGGIDFFLEAGRRNHLIVLGDSDLGYYLQFSGPKGCFVPDDIWLSLGDRSRLNEVVCPDDWEASAGLFIPRSLAWEAIRSLCLTGGRSPLIQWISHLDVPDTGNW
jgi:hypothetical protein